MKQCLKIQSNPQIHPDVANAVVNTQINKTSAEEADMFSVSH